MAAENLPVQLTSFIGRDCEVAALREWLAGSRLVTVTGPGGAGKTRLAIEAARDWDGDDVAFVELAPLADQALVASAIADAIGVVEAGGRPLIESITRGLGARRPLLVLDNCEHVVVGCAGVVEALLKACPQLTILATSREPLNAAGETVQRLQPLLPDEAIALFIARATGAEPAVAANDIDAGVVDGLCGGLDRLPLAIELAAPYVRVLSLTELAAQIGGRLDLLQARGSTTIARHQTLRALVDWSYELLGEDEQRLYRRLSVFAGGCALDAVAGICLDGAAAALAGKPDRLTGGNPFETTQSSVRGPQSFALLPLLQNLIEKSLVIAEETDGGMRYSMLETLRQHARDKLREAGEERELRQRHLEWFRDLAEQADAAWYGGEQDRWRRRLDLEIDNCRTALLWSRVDQAQRESALALAAAQARCWRMCGHGGEALAWLSDLLQGTALNATRAKALAAAGFLSARRGETHAGQQLLHDAASLAEATGARGVELKALSDLALALFEGGSPAAARITAEKALSIARAGQANSQPYDALRPLALAEAALGLPEEAAAHLRQAVRLAREQKDNYQACLALDLLGSLLIQLGDLAAARECLEDCLATETRLLHSVQTLARMADLAAAEGNLADAYRLAGFYSRFRDAWPDQLEPPRETHLESLGGMLNTASPALRQAEWGEGAAMSLEEAIHVAVHRGSRFGAGERPGGLTLRELEVVRLIAGELTNREIAAALVISERTAHRHVENILAKLNLPSRVRVAAWAIEHGLAQPPR